MRIAVLVKQIPQFESMEIGEGGRLVRDGLALEMNAYCRRAVAKGVELAGETSGLCTVLTLGPPPAADVLREAIAWGDAHQVPVDAVHVTGPELAGSDTLATARALAAAVRREGPFDLVLVGRNSLDADTGQVGPGVAELLGLPFAAGVKRLEIGPGRPDGLQVHVLCEEDDGTSERAVALPVVLSTAERLCEPCKVDAASWRQVAPERVRVLGVADLAGGPFGVAGSPTSVGKVKVHEQKRERRVLGGPLATQLEEVVALLAERGALSSVPPATEVAIGEPVEDPERVVAVVVEPARPHLARELLGTANALAAAARAEVVAIVVGEATASVGAGSDPVAAWGADRILQLVPARTVAARGDVAEEAGAAQIERPTEEDVAGAVRGWASRAEPWAILAPSTSWGREVASRVAVGLGAGLTGDAVALEVEEAVAGEPRLVAWKPALSGHLVVAIRCSSPVQMATVRPGVLARPAPRPGRTVPLVAVDVTRTGRVRLLDSSRDDDVEVLARAKRVVGVGSGVAPEEYSLVAELASVLGAELAATRRVTDKGWMAHARQVGITGRSIAPRLYVAIGISGKFNHMVGVRSAETVLAVNSDPGAPVFDFCDIGIVGDWHEVVPGLASRIPSGRTRSRP